VGIQAYVSDTTVNNIRQQAGSTTILGQIPPGAVFNVVGGPVCGSNGDIMWWEVEYNGIRGWTAEGKGNIYWLAPYTGIITIETPTGVTCTHIVQRGETLFRIGLNNKLTVAQLLTANPQINDRNRIEVGQILNIPGCGSGLSN
jgi:LysM repeat protein